MAYTMHLPRRSPLVLGLGCVALFLAACQHTGVQQGEPEALGSHVGATADGTPLGNPEVILETSRWHHDRAAVRRAGARIGEELPGLRRHRVL